jgi:SAM-dependent methyltransferase
MENTLLKPFQKIENLLNKNGKKRKCYLCNQTFNHFLPYLGGMKNVSPWFLKLQEIGSDIDNFYCPHCESFDRERHLFMYFDKLGIWERIKGANVLHFAPEFFIAKRIESLLPSSYIKADLFPSDESIQHMDAIAIPHEEATFDVLIFNHILEHIPDYKKALAELYRVLKPGGIAIMQTPYSRLLQCNFEDAGINTDELRLLYYGQEDHVRIFSEKQLLQSFQDTGFQLKIVTHNAVFTEEDAVYFGVNKEEDLIYLSKPGSV